MVEFPPNKEISSLIDFIKDDYNSALTQVPIYLISRRDNPKSKDVKDAEDLMSDLVDFFRTAEGRCLILWTITRQPAAEKIAEAAWAAGRNSVTSPETKGKYYFEGLEKQKYRMVADSTARSLTGDGLDSFGLSHHKTDLLLPSSETISDFYEKLNTEAQKIRGDAWSVLKEQVRPKLWIIVPADDPSAIEASVRSLTQGQRGRIDVDTLQEWVDNESNDANYAVSWRSIRHKMAYLFRVLDVRLFEMYPNAAVSAVRGYGDDDLRALLNSKGKIPRSSAQTTIRNTRFYKEVIAELTGVPQSFGGRGNIKSATHVEYRRIQALAEKRDSRLNRAVGAALRDALEQDLPSRPTVTVDNRSITGTTLRPDISITLDDVNYICLEPTWRSTGEALPGGVGKQNTLTPGYLQIYVMSKTLEYVKALGLFD
ncbi:hypothetical protein GIY56_02720 [Paracoccus sp. YIM 132242]|uniref:Uncharacterized protein n=1 Tax=Paracoccus lichenicola TaxID=2665644 RepID=A0A6L6HPF6_9RHOB|nr:hypothetical protein [Paracoccus lichenicola]MTD99197.1 hypothetical protein [Paracoccus lichenicola]